MRSKQIEDLYPLSPMQRGMLFHTLLAPDSGVYIQQLVCTLHGDLRVAAFEHAWRQVLDQHPVLRTSFVWEDLDEPMQVVQRDVPLPLEEHDWRGLLAAEQDARRQRLLET